MKIKRLILLVVPPLTYMLFVYAVIRVDYYIAGFLLAYFLPPAGKESVIPLMITYLHDYGVLSLVIAVLLITVTDTFTAFYVIWNFDIVLLIPKVGDFLRKLEIKAKNFIKDYDLAKNTYLGLFIFVFIPFQGTGSTTASVIGKILGFDNLKLFITIVSASLTSSIFISTISIYLTNYFKDYTFLIIIGLIFIIGVIFKSIKKYRIYHRIVDEAQRFYKGGR